MKTESYNHLISLLNESIIPINKSNYSQLINSIAGARFVLLGEASHGTEDFYKARMDISKRLIEDKGFMAIAIEGDWPNVYPLNRYIQGDTNYNQFNCLDKFQRFPQWLWRNSLMPAFLNWLHRLNASKERSDKIGIYGMDLYSLDSSINSVIEYLKKIDPKSAEKAIQRYSCFDSLVVDPQSYGYLANMGIKKSCIDEAVQQVMSMQRKAFDYLNKDGDEAQENYYFALENARLIKNAEKYYRSMFDPEVSSWNVRDEHMFEMINNLCDHLEKKFKRPAKIILWAHNSHLGNAKATESAERGELNIGQLMRDKFGNDVYSIGFSTYQGSVLAANDWGDRPEVKEINPGLKGSYEELFHDLSERQFFFETNKDVLKTYLSIPRLQRAIGVIYRPHSERVSHYFLTKLPQQFDAMIHIDKTKALNPLGDLI